MQTDDTNISPKFAPNTVLVESLELLLDEAREAYAASEDFYYVALGQEVAKLLAHVLVPARIGMASVDLATCDRDRVFLDLFGRLIGSEP